MVGEQKLGEGARELPLGAARMKKRPWLGRTSGRQSPLAGGLRQ
jgi:hypothetical protein